MKYGVNDNIYDVEIIKKNNKNTYIRVKDNKIFVTTNYFVTNSYIKKQNVFQTHPIFSTIILFDFANNKSANKNCSFFLRPSLTGIFV